MARKVAVIGIGNTTYTSIRRETRERSEVGRACIKSALDFVGRGLTLSDIDALYFASVDCLEGVQRPDRSTESLGQTYNIPVHFVNTGGTSGGSAFKDAYRYVAAGIYDIVLVYGASTFAACVDFQQVANTGSQPILERPIGIGALHMAGYHLTHYQTEHGITEEDFAMAAAKSHRHAVNNPYAHIRKGYNVEEILASPVVCSPLHLYETCPVSSGAVSVIMASEEKAKELSDTPVWIKTINSISDTYMAGYRNFQGFPMLSILAEKVYKKAGIKNPLEEIDYVEIFNPYAGFEYLGYEALGFCGEGEGPRLVREGVTDLNGKLPVNLSGGTLCTNSGIAASLDKHAEVCRQLMGKTEGGRQVQDARVGMAHSLGGTMWQFHTLAILTR